MLLEIILTLGGIILALLLALQLILHLKFKTIRDGNIALSSKIELIFNHFDRIQNNTHQLQQKLTEMLADNKLQLQRDLQLQRNSFEERQIEGLKLLQESIQKNMHDVRRQIASTLTTHSEMIGKRVDKLTEETRLRLREISGQVEKRLSEGFEKTTATFADVLKRLALIDEAQKRITELSTNVVTLQEVLSDKRSRGAFGEVQLSALIRNVLPESHFSFQYTFKNGKRADCILFLPEPTGNMVIDAKFPLESYRKMTDLQLSHPERKQAEKQFRKDIEKHINDIADKYIISGETSDGAMMFIPAEAVFAEIQAHFPGLVEKAHKRHVWMTSPTTMMAILTTIQAVLKDAQTRKEVHLIQEHLTGLAKDFGRFQDRMEKLAKHIHLANKDVEDVGRSARKISSRFHKIEKVEISAEHGDARELLDDDTQDALELLEDESSDP